ncbi:MAG: NAD(P)/FAD-dependent oxidoreductase [Bdellovibrio sp.]|nr:NAD(P)/FAD-dependent oxidoreductase [Bdellovibrio sp.]
MDLSNVIQNFILDRPVETLLIFSIVTSLPFFIYYVSKKYVSEYRLYKGFKKPKKFDYNLISIGPDGTQFITNFIKNNPKAKIVVVKNNKTMKAQSHLTPSDVAKASIDFLSGDPKIISPYEISLNGKTISAKNILIATGASSNTPDFIGVDKIAHYTPTTIWTLPEAPKKLLILGDNQTACEFAQTYAERESEVTLATALHRLLPDEDELVGEYILKNLAQQKITVLLNARLEKFEKTNAQSIAVFDKDDADLLIEFDVVLFCLGEIPNTAHIGLERLEIPLNPDGTIKVDSSLRTNYPTIYACGKAASYFD